MENLLYTLWLHLLPGIGPYLIKNLLATFDNATAIYHAPIDALITVPGIGIKLAQTITIKYPIFSSNCRCQAMFLLRQRSYYRIIRLPRFTIY